jgi:hypothetical protein
MKARVKPQFTEGWRLPPFQQGSLRTFEGFLVEDEVKPRDHGRIMKRLRLVDADWKPLHPELLSPRNVLVDGDGRLVEGFQLYKATSVSNPIYMMQEWKITVTDVMAVPPNPPALQAVDTREYLELFFFIYTDDAGYQVRTLRRIPRTAAVKIHGAICLENTRKRVRVDEEALKSARSLGRRYYDDLPDEDRYAGKGW